MFDFDAVELRKATLDDSAFILAVRNDDGVRAASKVTKIIAPHEHDAWMRARLRDKGMELYIVEACPMGQRIGIGTARLELRLASRPREAEIHLALLANWRSRGCGKQVIRLLVQRAAAHGCVAVACVRGSNIPSLRAFLHEGFRPSADGMLHLMHDGRADGQLAPGEEICIHGQEENT